MNLVLALALLGASSVAVWSGFTDPEGGTMAGLRNVLSGKGTTKRTSVAGAAFISDLASAIGSGSTGSTGGTVQTSAGTASGGRAAIVATARTWLGVKYVWGGTSRSGVDCSGLVLNVYKAHGITLPRVSQAQALRGRRVTTPQPGDLVAFGAPVFHIGIVTGPDQMIHAPNSRGVVRVEGIASTARGMRAPIIYRDVLSKATAATDAVET